ncbi:MAG: MFS transporter [Planctomycetota bacterium]
MRWPPPFRSLPNPAAIFAWSIYDLANQSFQLLINTLLFSIFVKSVLVLGEDGQPDPDLGTQVWGDMLAASLIGIIVLSPILGALADERAWKRELLIASGVICSTLTCLLAVLEPGQVYLGFALYVVAATACGLGENFLGSFLPEISTAENVGRVSAIGWTTSYLGAMLLLGATALHCFALARPDIEQARPMFVFSGLWFFAGMIPAMIWLREKAQPPAERASLNRIVSRSVSRLIQSARESARYRQLVWFYVAFFVYSIGTMTVIYFLGIIGDNFGFEIPQLIAMALVVAASAGVSAAIVGRVQDRMGHKRTIGAILVVWVAATLTMAGGSGLSIAPWFFWIISAMIGFALGGIGTSSRAMVGAFTPGSRAGEFFGVWGMVYKLSGVVGVLVFGRVSAAFGMPVALAVLAGFFATGLLLLMRIDEKDGIRAARASPSIPPGPERE